MGKICIGSYVFSITDDDGENHQVTISSSLCFLSVYVCQTL